MEITELRPGQIVLHGHCRWEVVSLRPEAGRILVELELLWRNVGGAANPATPDRLVLAVPEGARFELETHHGGGPRLAVARWP